ncbi:MAG: hypothetical protein M3Y87_18470, partial [Myxococcota bacterium]|nr:hypothetical protein [Myxococcota bacterium]
MRGALGTLALSLVLAAGCGGAPRPSERARVRFVLQPETARVYSDERYVGSARRLAARPTEFRVGPRRFTITADGYFPHDLEVDLPAGTTTIEISLRPVPP